MADLSTIVDGLKLPNPFVIGSGPPGTNANVIGKAFDEGWGAVICKTVSLDASKVINVQPRYARLRAAGSDEIIGWENIELISDRPFEIWIDEFKQIKDRYPDRVLIASIMEEYRKDAWVEIVERCQEAGVDALRVQFLLSARPARAADGLGDGRESGDPGGSLRLGDERGQGAGVGEDDAQRHAHRGPVAGRPARPAARASAPSTRSAASSASTWRRLRPEPIGRGLHDARRLFVQGGHADRAADVHGDRPADPRANFRADRCRASAASNRDATRRSSSCWAATRCRFAPTS